MGPTSYRRGPKCQSVMDEVGRLGFRFEIEFSQVTLEEPPSALRGVVAPDAGLESNEPAVGLLADRIEVDRPFQRAESSIDPVVIEMQLGQADVYVESSAMEILAHRFDPERVRVGIEDAAVGGTGTSKGEDEVARPAGPRRVGERRLEAPQINVED